MHPDSLFVSVKTKRRGATLSLVKIYGRFHTDYNGFRSTRLYRSWNPGGRNERSMFTIIIRPRTLGVKSRNANESVARSKRRKIIVDSFFFSFFFFEKNVRGNTPIRFILSIMSAKVAWKTMRGVSFFLFYFFFNLNCLVPCPDRLNLSSFTGTASLV